MGVLVGKRAPEFISKAVVGGKVQDFSLAACQGQYVLLFFYPLNFTFVCPTELHAFQEQLPEFEKRNTLVVGCSVDSCFSHLAWLGMPRSQGGINGVQYPILSDINKQIAKSYDVLNEEEGIAYRGLFLIDKGGVVRHQIVNDLPLGRSVDEAIRMIDALLNHEINGEVCPANWNPGKKAMRASLDSVIEYFSAPAKRT